MKNYTATIAGMDLQQFVNCLNIRMQQPDVHPQKLFTCISLIHELSSCQIPLSDISERYNIPIELKELT